MGAVFSKISGSLYILIIILFFLPFVSVSCDNKKVVQLTGVQMVTGTEVAVKGLLWQEKQRIPPQPLAIIPFGLAIAGLILGYTKSSKLKNGLQMLLSTGACVSLFLLKNKITENVLRYPKIMFVINYLPYYWITLTLFILAAVLSGAGLFLKDKNE